MKKTIEVDTKDIQDITRVIREIISWLQNSDDFITIPFCADKATVRVSNLIRYEKYCRHYVFVYEDDEYICTSMIGRRLTDNNTLPGFFAINRNDVINLKYVKKVCNYKVYFKDGKTVLIVSRRRAQALVKMLEL